MVHFIWRKWTRVVAYMEVAMSIRVFLKTMLAVFATALMATRDEMIAKDETLEQLHTLGPWWKWHIVLSVVGLHLWASLKLLSATKMETCYCDALRNVLIWRMVTYTFFFIEVAGVIMDIKIYTAGFTECYYYAYGSALVTRDISFLWRGILLFIASKYMTELETKTTIVPVGRWRR